MKRVGVYEAKTHFSALIRAVAKGERVIITQRGRPIAELIPPLERGRAAVEKLMKNEIPLGVPVREAIDEGRK